MRIIGQIEHPQLKISVFKNENRLFLKLENERYEQTYKLGDDERFKSASDVQQLADPAFIEQVLLQMRQMHQNKLSALARAFPPEQTAEFEEII